MLSTVLQNYDLCIITFDLEICEHFNSFAVENDEKILAAAHIGTVCQPLQAHQRPVVVTGGAVVFGGLTHLTPLFNCTPFFAWW